MNVSLDEHRLGGLRWIVLRGPDQEAFRALGEHMRDEMAALIKTWGLVARLREHVSGSPGRDRLASVRQASTLGFPEPWAELAAFAEGGAVLQTVELDRGGFACMLGGPRRTTLFIVAATWQGMTESEMVAPGSGQVLATDVDVPGAGWP